MRLVLGTYALAWGRPAWRHRQVMDAAAAEDLIGGLEVPWAGTRADSDLVEVLRRRPDWQVVVTSLPSTMARIAVEPEFGLASPDRAGRQAAVADAASLRSWVASLNDTIGRPAVSAIEFHSAPGSRDVPHERAALAQSLDTIARWDWSGAQLLLEHVDAKIERQAPAKGFLPLEEELGVISAGSLPMGVLINWGRSAIELRSAERVVDHVAMAKDSGLLRGLIFSGASAVPTRYGEAWADQHLPPHPHERDSLLTADMMDDALRVAGPLEFTGVKMSSRGASLRKGTVMVLSTARTVSALGARHGQSIP